MNCDPCAKQDHENCINLVTLDGAKRNPPTTTWCACQHKEVQGYIDPTKCQHTNFVYNCPTCPMCKRRIPLQMTKNQAGHMLYAMICEWKDQPTDQERDAIIELYAERFLNDRPTISVSDAEASFSEL